ncbi:MAG: ECF-type sigma factor [Dokdonella sp.]
MTELLANDDAGESTSAPSFEAVYARLKAMASRQLQRGARHTLDTTALVHELYVRMEQGPELAFAHSAQFFTYAARAMRHLLIDHARARMFQKSGGDWARVTFTASSGIDLAIGSAEQALALDDALTRLEQIDARAAQVVELRYFAGLTTEQVASLLEVTARTINRDWRFARAFLHDALL